MPFTGAGSYVRVHNWKQDDADNIKIRADRHDEEDDALAAGLSNTVCRDGQSTIIADMPWNNKKITGLGAATAGDHALSRDAGDSRYGNIASAALTSTDPYLDVVLPSGCLMYQIDVVDFAIPSAGPFVGFRTSFDGGATFLTGPTDYNFNALRYVSGGPAASSGSSTLARLTNTLGAPYHNHLSVKLWPGSSGQYCRMLAESVETNSNPEQALSITHANVTSVGKVNAIRFVASSGQIDVATIRVRGLLA